MSRQSGAGTKLLAAFESVYGTAPASGFFEMPFLSTTLSSEQGLIASEVLGQGRDATDPFRDVINVDGDVVVPVDVRGIGTWLKALLGAPTTAGTTPKTHTYTSGAAALPSLAVEVQYPAVPVFNMETGVKVDSMKLAWARSGLPSATFACIAQGEAKNTSSQGGTPTTRVLKQFSQFQGSISLNSSVLAGVVSGEMTYANNLDRVEVIRSDGKIDGADEGLATCTGNLVTRFADTTLLDLATAGTAVQLDLGWTISASEKLLITLPRVFLPKPKLAIPGPGGVQATFDWQAAKNGATPMLTVVLTNDVTSY